MTKAQKIIRKAMIRWGDMGLKAGLLSDDTGYAFSTCKKEIQRVIADGYTETAYDGFPIIKNLNEFQLQFTNEGI